MFYVYILKSEKDPKRFYMGSTSNLKRRFAEHNRGDSTHTSQYRPWKLINYFAFINKERAEAFEHYLKSGAGRRFQLQHFGE
jgi:putative endonuclease